MRVHLMSPILVVALSAVPVLAQSGATPTYNGRIFGDVDNIRADGAALNALAAVPVGSGLEVEDYRDLRVVVSDLPDALREIGVTREQVLARVDSLLASRGIGPSPQNVPRAEWLAVELNGVGPAYRIDLSFNRRAFYFSFSEQDFFAPTDVEIALISSAAETWSTGSVGAHGGDASFVFNSLERRVEEFLNDYVAANRE